MRTTHVVRGEEWLSSLPMHIALFDALGFEPPCYCHTALLMKMDGETKRKLSKRKDPELSLSYYMAEGYHPRAIEEYLLTIVNSNYEEWRIARPEADNAEFLVTTGKMGVSGILFDLEKLEDVSKEALARIPAGEIADFLLRWAARERPDALPVLARDRGLLVRALDIGRGGDKPRKDLAYAKQIFSFIAYFFDEYFRIEDPLPQNVPAEDAPAILEDYLGAYAHGDARDVWFGKIRAIAEAHGYAAKPKDFKKNPDLYKGHVGDVSAVVRLALVGRANSPDIWEIQQILGEERVRERIARILHARGESLLE
jgi:glutamyl-tRNA synthetase